MRRFNRRCILFIMVLLLGFGMIFCKRANFGSCGGVGTNNIFGLQEIQTKQVFAVTKYTLHQAKEAVDAIDSGFYMQCIQNLNQGNDITYADGYYYFRSQVENYSLCRSKGISEPVEVVSDMMPNEIYVRDNTVYFINASDNQSFYSVKTDGTDLTKLSDCPMKNMIIINDTVYFLSVYEREYDPFYQLVEDAAEDDRYLYSMKLDGTERKLLVPQVCVEFSADENKLYYEISERDSENIKYTIYECDLNGTNKQVILQSEKGISELVSYKGDIYGQIYVYDERIYQIIKIDQKGEKHILISDAGNYYFMISQNNIYLRDEDRMYTYNLKTGEKSTFISKEKNTELWDIPYDNYGTFFVNGNLFVKSVKSQEKGALWYIWDKDRKGFDIFEDAEVKKPEEMVSDTSIFSELLFDYPGERDNSSNKKYIAEKLTYADAFLTLEDGREFGRFSFSLPLFNFNIQGSKEINQVMRNLMNQAEEEKDSFFRDIKEEAMECPDWHLTYDYSYLYVGEKYISMLFYVNGYTGGVREWEEALPMTFDRKTGQLLTMDDLFTVDNISYMNRLTSALYKYFEMEEVDLWSNFDANILVKNFEPNCFYLTENGIVLCYDRYAILPGCYGNPSFEIPYSWFEDILVYGIEKKEDTNQSQSDYTQAYIDIINEFEKEFPEWNQYDLIYLDDDDVPELVADVNGYYVSVLTYDNGVVYTLMDDMAYGSQGCVGYEYLPRQNVVHCFYLEQGIIAHDCYMTVGNDHELNNYYEEELSIMSYQDKNENGEGFQYYFYGNNEITEEEYDSYMIQGEYEYLYGTKTAEEIIHELQEIS